METQGTGKTNTMPGGDIEQTFKLRPPDLITMTAIEAEVISARVKFPGSRFLLTALMEEVGELAGALLEDQDRDEIEKECIQVAAVGVRLCEELGAVLADPSSRGAFAELIREVGETARGLLQNKWKTTMKNQLAGVSSKAYVLDEHGDSTFNDLTEAEAKP